MSERTLALRAVLQRCDELLAPLDDREPEHEDLDGLHEAWVLLHGNSTCYDIPYEDRRQPAHELIPHVPAWCVVKHYNDERHQPGHARAWPGMVFTSRKLANRWADFLGDFFNTWGDRFEVEWIPGPVQYSKDPCLGAIRGTHVGDGYTGHDPRKPMVRWRYNQDKHRWVRIKKAA